MSEREFVCIDCGVSVISFGEVAANDQPLCAQCTWLRDIEDPEERETLRAWLKKIGE